MSKGEGGMPPELASMLGSLLSNPAALSAVSSLLAGGGSLGQSGRNERKEEWCDEQRDECHHRDECRRTPCECRESCDYEDRTDSCMYDGHGSHDGDDCPKAPPILPPKKPHRPKRDCGRDDRRQLLDALRPYLSPARCETVDSLLRILELLEMIRRRR